LTVEPAFDILNAVRGSLGRDDVDVETFLPEEAFLDRDEERCMPPQHDEIERERDVRQLRGLRLRAPDIADNSGEQQPGEAKAAGE
jgi:hypothetical protein